MTEQKGAKVGLFSRVDYGSNGFRRGLLETGFEIFRKEAVHYVLLIGGLISYKATRENLKEFVDKTLEPYRTKKRRMPKEILALPASKRLKALKLRFQDKFLRSVAEDLSRLIPRLTIPDTEDPKKERPVDIFVVTSPAFDGELGETVANYLKDLREDIRIFNAGGDRFPVKFVDKLIWALAPQKAVWMRGDYYSTAAERMIKDKTKQTSQSLPDVYAIGTFGSSINKPKGELRYSYVSVPVLHRLEDTRVNENQVGVSVMEFPSGDDSYLYTVYSFKDLVAKELSFIAPPEGSTGLQKKIVELIKHDGWVTPGLIRYQLGDQLSDDQISGELTALMKKKTSWKAGESWPGVTYKEASKRYYLDLEWIQRKLRYPLPLGPFSEDRIVSFACFHAGSVETDYEFFLKQLPEIILKTGATILVDAGDTKEGTRHNLVLKGEVIAGANNTTQEKIAANFVGPVIHKVFEKRFKEYVSDLKKDDSGYAQKLATAIDRALLQFMYILGNHDLWETEDGHTPLEVFRSRLVEYLIGHIWVTLGEHGHTYSHEELAKLVDHKVSHMDFFDLPSGLKVSVQHPHMSRAKTTSLRPQEMLEYAKRHNCQVAIGGNFHVSENVEEWDQNLGQCVCMEIGTIKHGSNFERHKMKMVDQGVGFLKIISLRDKKNGGNRKKKEDKEVQRIFITQSAFFGEAVPKPPIDSLEVLNAFFVQRFGIEPIK